MTQIWCEGIYLFVNFFSSLMGVLTLTIFQSNPFQKRKRKLVFVETSEMIARMSPQHSEMLPCF